ncbi:MAG: hypothetical protein ACRCTE_08455 [Cellulosilyticaceae bacterium]
MERKSYQIENVIRTDETCFFIQSITLEKLIGICTYCEVSIPLKWASEKNFRLKLDTEYVKKIEKQILEHHYLPTAIIMKVFGYHEALYDEQKQVLKITDQQLLHLTEGLHRILAILDIADRKDVLNDEMALKIEIANK